MFFHLPGLQAFGQEHHPGPGRRVVQIAGDGLELGRGVGVHPAQDEELPGSPQGGRPGLGQKLRQPHLLGLPDHFAGRLPGLVRQRRLQAQQRPVHEELLVPVKEIEGFHGAAFQMAF